MIVIALLWFSFDEEEYLGLLRNLRIVTLKVSWTYLLKPRGGFRSGLFAHHSSLNPGMNLAKQFVVTLPLCL
jgi:hypothetical protein